MRSGCSGAPEKKEKNCTGIVCERPRLCLHLWGAPSPLAPPDERHANAFSRVHRKTKAVLLGGDGSRSPFTRLPSSPPYTVFALFYRRGVPNKNLGRTKKLRVRKQRQVRPVEKSSVRLRFERKGRLIKCSQRMVAEWACIWWFVGPLASIFMVSSNLRADRFS